MLFRSAVFPLRRIPRALVPSAALGFLTLLLLTSAIAPSLLPGLIAAALAVLLLVLAGHYITVFWAGWLLITGLSLEMALTDLIGPEAFQTTIAAVKGGEFVLAALLALRFGMSLDLFNPAWAFCMMAMLGAAVGTHPTPSNADLVRSLIGSITPFLPFFCLKPPDWARIIRLTTSLVPLCSAGLGLLLDVAGIRPVIVESGGMRLAGLGHPAFLAGVTLTAVYAGLISWMRTGARMHGWLLSVNLIILVLTGARAPIAYAAAVTILCLIFGQSAEVPRRTRICLIAVCLIALPIVLVLGEAQGSLRLFTLGAREAAHLSGRDLLWPAFEAAADQAPWFGWGLGSGNIVIPRGSQIAQMLRTWAAHNEYLRIRVEGGAIGLMMLITCFIVWVMKHSRRLPPLERLVTRAVFAAFAAHAATDNVLISSPACVFFAFVAAVFAEPRNGPANRLRTPVNVA